MPHAITALVTKDHISLSEAKKYDLTYFFENGFYIIALDSCHESYWVKKLNINVNENNFFGFLETIHLDFIFRLTTDLKISKFGLISTDYHGGIGYQIAAFYIDNIEVIKENNPHIDSNMGQGSINTILKELGVKRSKKRDEFDAINLGKYRSFERYYENYIESCE